MIQKRKCQHCGRNDYHGLLIQHMTAWHASKVAPMVPITPRYLPAK